MLSLRRPDSSVLAALLVDQRRAAPTYADLGATARTLPNGYRHDHYSAPLGVGEDAFRRACEGLRDWVAHRGAGVSVYPPDAPPADVDVALVYDGFTFNAISWIEALGFCGIGEAKDWIDGGRRIALDGELPVNPHGGQLSEGRTHGFGFLYEAVTQLRHEAGERQVRDARTAVVSTGGGTPSGVLLLQRG